MVVQARAEATRRRIIESAVDLFDELGYGETGLADVLQRAGVSKGAFYYHFDSKEAVAAAIIQEYRRRVKQAISERTDASAPALENMILATFTSAATIEADKTARIGNELLQALGQVSSVAGRVYHEWTQTFINGLTKAFAATGLRDGVDATEAAEAAWTSVLGCHLLSSAMGDDGRDRLARAWRAMVRATVPDDVLDHYFGVLESLSSPAQTVGAVAS